MQLEKNGNKQKPISTKKKASSYISSLLKRKRYCKKELIEKLKKRETPNVIINEVINEINFDEVALKIDLIEVLNKKNYGKIRIINELKRRGLYSENDEEYFDKKEELIKINQIIAKSNHANNNLSYLSYKDKVKARLILLGYESENINEALSKMLKFDEISEITKVKNEISILLNKYEKLKDNKKEIFELLSKKKFQIEIIKKAWEEYENEHDQ